MKPLVLALIIFCLFLLGASGAILFYTQYVIYEIKDMPMDVMVSDHPGFNLDTDIFHFGRATTPGGSERGITITNSYTKPLRVTIQTYGDIGKWVYVKEYDSLFKPGEIKDIMLGINVPSDIPYGDYNGTIRILFTRVLI